MHNHCATLHPHPMMEPLEMPREAVCEGADLHKQSSVNYVTQSSGADYRK